jgi:hypothetical protein
LQDSRHTALRGGGLEDRLGEGFGAASGIIIVALIIKFLLKKFNIATPAPDNHNLIEEGIELAATSGHNLDPTSDHNSTSIAVSVFEGPWQTTSGLDYNTKTDPSVSVTDLAAESSIIVTSAVQSSSPSTNTDEAVNPILEESSNLEERTSPTPPAAILADPSAKVVAAPRSNHRFE